ncbi:MAG: chemotaxis protein CheW [Methylococcales bacterium]|nr:chemotaxis protein CheW [Methylococcales bacterium]
MQSKKTGHQVVNQEIALDTYLSTLLGDIVSEQAEEQTVELPKKQRLIDKLDVVANPQLEVNEKLAESIKPLMITPDWTQHEFQALFFKVDKLILATPLISLLRTVKTDKKPRLIPGQPSWFMGLLDINEQRVAVLDTGQLILGKVTGQQRDLEQQPFKCILITHDGKWGLACDEILTIGKLEPEKVRWRANRKKRPWLIGTIIDELTAVIDVNELVPHRKAS